MISGSWLNVCKINSKINFDNDKKLNKQKIIENIITSCTENNIEEKINEILKDDSVLRIQQSTIFKTPHTRSEIYALCSLYIVARGILPADIIKLNDFVNCNYSIRYDISKGENYFKEFINSKTKIISSQGGQKYNVPSLILAAKKVRENYVNLNNNNKPEICYLSNLPNNMITEVFYKLSPINQFRLRQTSKFFHRFPIVGNTLKVTLNKIDGIFISLLSFIKSDKCLVTSIDLSNVDLSKKDKGQTENRFKLLCNVINNKLIVNSLILSDCKLRDMFNEENISKLIHLTSLDISRNNFEDHHIKFLPNLINLETLIINEDSKNLIDKICIISKMKKLKELHIIGIELSKEMVRYISQLSNLHTLDISGSHVEAESGKHLINIKSLKKLYIRTCRLYEETIEDISQMSNLSFIDFTYCSIAGKRRTKLVTREQIIFESHLLGSELQKNFE